MNSTRIMRFNLGHNEGEANLIDGCVPASYRHSFRRIFAVCIAAIREPC
jgi:hypothetical protein